MAAGRCAGDRRGVVGHVGIGAVGIERQMAVGAGERGSDGACPAAGIAHPGDRQTIAVGIAGVRQYAGGRGRGDGRSGQIGRGAVGRDRRTIDRNLRSRIVAVRPVVHGPGHGADRVTSGRASVPVSWYVTALSNAS